MPTEKRARKRLRRREAARDRQWAKYQETGKQGHLKAFKRHSRAVAFLKNLIRRLVLREDRPCDNFAYSEFDCHDGRRVPEASYEALDHLCQTYLEPLRARFGPVFVTSGYRPADYNRRIGGATQSVHIYDYPGRGNKSVAADVVCATGTPAQWASFLEGLGPGGLCPYPSSGFVHVDNRQLMGWPDARWGA